MTAIGIRATLALALVTFTTVVAPSVGATARTKGVLSSETDTVLAFSGGGYELTLVDLDESRVVRRPLGGALLSEGQGASGDSDHFVVIDYDAGAKIVPIDGSPPIPVGQAFFAFDAHRDGEIWLTDWASGAVGEGNPRFRLVGLDGAVRTTAVPDTPELAPQLAFPQAASGRTIVFDSRAGLRLWNTSSGAVTILGDEAASVGSTSASGRFVSWCEHPCSTAVHVADLANPQGYIKDTVVTRTHGRPLDVSTSAFDPHGRYLAVMRGDRAGSWNEDSRGDLVVVDVVHGTQTVVARDIPRRSYPAWSPDGRRLFFSEYSWMRSTTGIGVYDLDRGTLERATVPIGNVTTFRVLSTESASALLIAPDVERSECASSSPMFQPELVKPPCAFDIEVTERSRQRVAVEQCLVTTGTDVGVSGFGLYGGDPFEEAGDDVLRVEIPNSGERIAGSRADGTHDFGFSWAGPGGQEVEVTGTLVDGAKRAMFELRADTGYVSDPGCWRFTGRAGDDTLTVTMLVTAAD